MLERLHEHINLELRVNTRTDTIFVVTAVVFNFVMLAIGSSMASEATADFSDNRTTPMIVLFITLGMTLLVNGIAIVGLMTGRATRERLSEGLFKMYKDAEVDQYYEKTLLENYMRRYVIFTTIIGLLAINAIAIPLVVLLTN